MTDKHTPGPWILESYTSGGETRFFVRTRGAIQVDDFNFAGSYLGFAIAGGIREADAPLIAAAPEMRKALADFQQLRDTGSRSNRAWSAAEDNADAALAKARGE